MKTSFVEKLLLVTGFTTKLSLHFYDFSEIVGTIYKIKKLNPRSIESICTEAPRIFHQGPSKTLIFTELPPAAQGRSPAVNTRPRKRLGQSTCSPSTDWWRRLRREGLRRPSPARSRQRTRPCSDSGEGSGIPQQCAARGASTRSKGEVRVVGARRHRVELGAPRRWCY
jgi:hypothetical protein